MKKRQETIKKGRKKERKGSREEKKGKQGEYRRDMVLIFLMSRKRKEGWQKRRRQEEAGQDVDENNQRGRQFPKDSDKRKGERMKRINRTGKRTKENIGI